MITLYTAARCPYAARVRIVLAERAVPYEAVEIDAQATLGVKLSAPLAAWLERLLARSAVAAEAEVVAAL